MNSNESIYLSIGSNIEDRYKNLINGIKLINKHPHIWVVKKSHIYDSMPMYNLKQNNYYNMVIQIETNLEPINLLKICKSIELKLGRKISSKKYSSRELDIDILTFGNIVIKTSILTIPHPLIHERKFVLLPWNDISPDFILPNYNKTVNAILNETKDNSKINRILNFGEGT